MKSVAVGASRRVKYITMALPLVVICFALLVWMSPDRITHRNEFKTGDMIVRRVESFKNEHRRLPVDIDELGIPEAESLRVYFQKESADHYVVWFGTTLGESIVYDSVQKSWN
jgi:hypothetical protein